MKFGSRAHRALAEFAAQHPGKTFTASELQDAVVTGYGINRGSVIPGDHAVQPDGSPVQAYV